MKNSTEFTYTMFKLYKIVTKPMHTSVNEINLYSLIKSSQFQFFEVDLE